MSTKPRYLTSKLTRTLVRAVVPLRHGSSHSRLEATLKVGIVFSAREEDVRDVEEAVAEALNLDPATVTWYRSRPVAVAAKVPRVREDRAEGQTDSAQGMVSAEEAGEGPAWADDEPPEPPCEPQGG